MPDLDIASKLVNGTDVEALTALREVLAQSLLNASEDKRAGLSREYRNVLADLTRLGASREESKVDELGARRARRRAGRPAQAADQGGAAGG